MRETTMNKKIEKLKADAIVYLADLRRKLLNNFPFAGALSFNLDLVPVRDNRVSTACTDGKAIYFDINYLNSLKRDEAVSLIAHEVWHNAMLHFIRTENRDRNLFNIATDLEVNQILAKEGMQLNSEWLMPSMYDLPYGLSAEEYYDRLIKRDSKSSKLPSSSSSSSSSSNSSSSSSNQRSNSSSSKSDGKSESKSGQESESGKSDKHLYSDYDPESDKGDENAEDKLGKIGHDEDFNPNMAASEKNAENIREAVVQAAQQLERTKGELPDYLKKIVNKLLQPEVDWKQVLQQFTTKTVGSKNTWNAPNRRFAWNGTYLPSHEDESIKLAIGIDTSGSVVSYVTKFLSEINGIVKAFPSYKLTIIQCDAEVKKVSEYDNDNPLDLENEKFELEGFGGTRLKPIFDYISLNEVEHDAIVVLTDGFCEDFKESDSPEKPTLWMVTKGGNTKFTEFGEVYEFEKDDLD